MMLFVLKLAFKNKIFFNSSSFVGYSQNLFLKRLSVCIAFLSSLFTKSASFLLSVLFLIEHVYLLLWETHFLFGHRNDVDPPGLKKYLDLKWRWFKMTMFYLLPKDQWETYLIWLIRLNLSNWISHKRLLEVPDLLLLFLCHC